MCEKLRCAAATTTITNEGVSDLHRTLMKATSFPKPKRTIIAVVEDQSVAKSSTINDLLNRNLVEVIGGSEVCTAFAAIIEHKRGA